MDHRAAVIALDSRVDHMTTLGLSRVVEAYQALGQLVEMSAGDRLMPDSLF